MPAGETSRTAWNCRASATAADQRLPEASPRRLRHTAAEQEAVEKESKLPGPASISVPPPDLKGKLSDLPSDRRLQAAHVHCPEGQQQKSLKPATRPAHSSGLPDSRNSRQRSQKRPLENSLGPRSAKALKPLSAAVQAQAVAHSAGRNTLKAPETYCNTSTAIKSAVPPMHRGMTHLQAQRVQAKQLGETKPAASCQSKPQLGRQAGQSASSSRHLEAPEDAASGRGYTAIFLTPLGRLAGEQLPTQRLKH